MNQDTKRQEIIRQIQKLAADNDGQAPGQKKFAAETGIKDHIWRGKYWRGWSEALVEAGFAPNEWQGAYEESAMLLKITELAKRLQRFPKTIDLTFEANHQPDFPSANSIKRRWNMVELAVAIATHGKQIGDEAVVVLANDYLATSAKLTVGKSEDVLPDEPTGYVYMYRYGTDYKIGHTKSLNKRARQIQIELPAETVLIHAILTDDPVGIESYWHKRFTEKRTRGEWFKLSKSEIAAFKRWTKIW